MEELARGLWDKKSLPPSWLYERTPAEILFLFGGKIDEEGEDVDPLAELAHWNHKAALRGEKPKTPTYLMPGVPRGR